VSRSPYARGDRRSVGAALNLAPQSTACPPGFHWEAPAPIQGLGACVADPPVRHPILNLHLGPAPAAPAPKVIPLHLGPAPAPAPVHPLLAPAVTTTSDRATAPAPAETPAAPAATCGDCWPLWWLLVAGAAGAGIGWVARPKPKKGRKPNPAEQLAGRLAGPALRVGTRTVTTMLFR